MTNKPLASRIAQLQRMLLESDDFAAISEFFSEHLIDDPAFVRLGKAAAAPELAQAVRAALRACFGACPLYGLTFLNVAEFGLWHGAAAWRKEGLVLVIYLEGLDLGLLSVAGSMTESVVHFVRFGLSEVPGVGFLGKRPLSEC
jgi:hypothetical protein